MTITMKQRTEFRTCEQTKKGKEFRSVEVLLRLSSAPFGQTRE